MKLYITKYSINTEQENGGFDFTPAFTLQNILLILLRTELDVRKLIPLHYKIFY